VLARVDLGRAASIVMRMFTGKREEIYHVGKDMFKADGSVGPQKTKSYFIHTKSVYLVDKSLRIRGIYDTSASSSMKLLAQDLSRLKVE